MPHSDAYSTQGVVDDVFWVAFASRKRTWPRTVTLITDIFSLALFCNIVYLNVLLLRRIQQSSAAASKPWSWRALGLLALCWRSGGRRFSVPPAMHGAAPKIEMAGKRAHQAADGPCASLSGAHHFPSPAWSHSLGHSAGWATLPAMPFLLRAVGEGGVDEQQYVDLDDAAAAPSPADEPDTGRPGKVGPEGGRGADHHAVRSPLRAPLAR
jgi:hypothetical protein